MQGHLQAQRPSRVRPGSDALSWDNIVAAKDPGGPEAPQKLLRAGRGAFPLPRVQTVTVGCGALGQLFRGGCCPLVTPYGKAGPLCATSQMGSSVSPAPESSPPPPQPL